MKKVIYCLKNNVTGRVYVGMTTNPNNRYKQHLSALYGKRHKNNLMQEDFNKYGDTFTFEILEKGVCCQNHAELRWILRFKSFDKEFGYNYKDPSVITRHGNYSKAVADVLDSKVDNQSIH